MSEAAAPPTTQQGGDPVQSVREESVQWFAQYKAHKCLPASSEIQDAQVARAVLTWERALLSSIVQLRCVDRVSSYLEGVPEPLQHTVQDGDRHALLQWHRESLAALQKDLQTYTSCFKGYMSTVQNVEQLVQQRLDMLNAMDKHTAFTRVVPQLAKDFAKRTALMAMQAHENKTTTLDTARQRLLRYAPECPEEDGGSAAYTRSDGGDTSQGDENSSLSSDGASYDATPTRRPRRGGGHKRSERRSPPHRGSPPLSPVHRARRPKPVLIMADDNTTVVNQGTAGVSTTQRIAQQRDGSARTRDDAAFLASDKTHASPSRRVVDSSVMTSASRDAGYHATATTALHSAGTRSTIMGSGGGAGTEVAAPVLSAPVQSLLPAASGAGGDGNGVNADRSDNDSRDGSDSQYSGSTNSGESSGGSSFDGSTDAYASDDSMDTRTEEALTREYSSDRGDDTRDVYTVSQQFDQVLRGAPSSGAPNDTVDIMVDGTDNARSAVTPVEVFVSVPHSTSSTV